MIVRTRIFELCHRRYRNLSMLAQAMEMSVSQVYRVRQGKRNINQKFIVGAIKAFPEYKLDELFYFTTNSPTATREYYHSPPENRGHKRHTCWERHLSGIGAASTSRESR